MAHAIGLLFLTLLPAPLRSGLQDRAGIPLPEPPRPLVAPDIADMTVSAARRAVDGYAMRVSMQIESLARSGRGGDADKLEALLDDCQDQLDRGDISSATKRLDTFTALLRRSFNELYGPRALGAFAAVLLSHAAGEQGVAGIADREEFEKLSYRGNGLHMEPHLRGIESVKFYIQRSGDGPARIRFLNTVTFRSHKTLMRALGIVAEHGSTDDGYMLGAICYRPLLAASDGSRGLYTFEFGPNDAYEFDLIRAAYELLQTHAPVLRGRLAYCPVSRAAEIYEQEKNQFKDAAIPVFQADDAFREIAFLPLNNGVAYGRLRLMRSGDYPTPRDVVLCPALPGEMPRVAGIITAVRQTPLSHVNLRAVQDQVPNAYVRGATEEPGITRLLDRYVRYKVTDSGFEIREATSEEVLAQFEAMRPRNRQRPQREMQVRRIKPLQEVRFEDWKSVGVKAANVAVLRTLGFPEGTVPKGFSVPFSFYDSFMRANGLYQAAETMALTPGFETDTDVRIRALTKLRQRIRNGVWPEWARTQLVELQRSFPPGTQIRCRSSTNNEDLPGFSGAGLYDSYTHRDPERPIGDTIRKVYASLWNFRAFEERVFHRIDHEATAMGVLVHPNYSDEQANGVAVTNDVLYQSPHRRYYVNVQIGEDLVTNPATDSVPEEWLLSPAETDQDSLVNTSNRVKDGARVLSEKHRDELRSSLGRIHRKFKRLYGHSRAAGEFAMEIEFKITAEGQLAIKQARPWLY